MSKKETKALKTKKKPTGFEILYRVVSAALAVAIFPVMYFLNLIYYALDWTSAINLINNFKDILNSENLIEGLKNLLSGSSTAGQTQEISDGYICLAKLDEFKSLLNMAGSSDTNLKDLLFGNASLRPLVVSFAFIAVMLVIALVIIVVSAVANKPKVVAVLSGVGSVFGLLANIVFNNFFANPLINDKITLSELIGGKSSFIVNMLGDVIELHYDNAFFVALALMVAVFIWSLSVIIVNADDKTEKALREAKKAERTAKKAKKAAKKAEKTAKKAAKALEEQKAEENAE